jgi:hypothetical protein
MDAAVPSLVSVSGFERERSNMPRTIAAAVAAVSVMLLGAPIAAHHAFSAEFDADKPVTLRGAVTRIDWINPHSWLYIDVKDPTGKVVPWKIEMGAPNQLLRRGWNKNSLPVGTEVIVEGFRAKNGSDVANGGNVVLADGRKLFVGSSGTGAPYDEKK